MKSPFWDDVHPGMLARVKHRVILVRHGESASNRELTSTGETSEVAIDSPLTDVGRQQANDLAAKFASLGIGCIDAIECSPLDRAWATALPTIALKDCNAPILVDYNLREKYTKDPYWCTFGAFGERTDVNKRIEIANFDKDTFEEDECSCFHWKRLPDVDFASRVESLITRWAAVDSRTQTLVFTHSQVISQILAGKSDRLFHLTNGSITVIDFDEAGHMNVQVVGMHIQTPTGMHTAF